MIKIENTDRNRRTLYLDYKHGWSIAYGPANAKYASREIVELPAFRELVKDGSLTITDFNAEESTSPAEYMLRGEDPPMNCDEETGMVGDQLGELIVELDDRVDTLEGVIGERTELNASEIPYEPAISELTATDVQAAIDEIAGDASTITYDNAVSGLAATDVKAAIDEIAGDSAKIAFTNASMASDNVSDAISELKAINTDTGEPTGIIGTPTIAVTPGTPYTVSITGTYSVYFNGRKYNVSTQKDATFDAAVNGLYWVYFTEANPPVLAASLIFPGMTVPLVCTVYYNKDATNATKYLIGYEAHGVVMSGKEHELWHKVIGARYESGFAGTFTDTTTSIGSGIFWDEDIEHKTIVATTQCRVLFRDASLNWDWTDLQNAWFSSPTGPDVKYDSAGTPTSIGANKYGVFWVAFTNDPNCRVYSFMGQAEYATVELARAASFENMSFGTLPIKELKLLYKVIARQDGTPYVETTDYRSVTSLPSQNYIATNHSALSGLPLDTHPQYLPLAGRTGGYSKVHTYGSGTTSGTATADLITIDLATNNTILNGVAQISVHEADNTHAGWWDITLAGHKEAGNATAINTAAGWRYYEKDLDASLDVSQVAVVASGTTIIIRVTGTLAKDFIWTAYAEYFIS